MKKPTQYSKGDGDSESPELHSKSEGFKSVSAVPSKRRCDHPDFTTYAEIYRLSEDEGGPINGYSADITIKCSVCEMFFRWLGLEKGISPNRPMASFDGLELRAPITPVEEL
jgi:hypothetical protein